MYWTHWAKIPYILDLGCKLSPYSGYLRLVAGCGYLVVICYVGLKIIGFGFEISLGVIWDLLIWFGLVFRWCFKGGCGVWFDWCFSGCWLVRWWLVFQCQLVVMERQRGKRQQYFFIYSFCPSLFVLYSILGCPKILSCF